MVAAGAVRQRLARVLNAAYGDGLLSEATFAHRLDLLFDRAIVDPASLIGDLTFRAPRRPVTRDLRTTLATWRDAVRGGSPSPATEPALLGLDWTGGHTELLVGRHRDCDIVLTDPSISRRHAQLRFRDGGWIVRDLDSTNGTRVNGCSVVRCRLQPGDHLTLGDASLVVD